MDQPLSEPARCHLQMADPTPPTAKARDTGRFGPPSDCHRTQPDHLKDVRGYPFGTSTFRASVTYLYRDTAARTRQGRHHGRDSKHNGSWVAARWHRRTALSAALGLVLGTLLLRLPAEALGQLAGRPVRRNPASPGRCTSGDAASINLPGPSAIKCTGSSGTDYRRGVGVEVRRWATCDGTTDDEAAFDAAYALDASGGGTIVVPAGTTCSVSAQLSATSHVDQACEPGATLKATEAASFLLGMLSHFLTNSADVAGCAFDLNGRKGPALSVLGARASA